MATHQNEVYTVTSTASSNLFENSLKRRDYRLTPDLCGSNRVFHASWLVGLDNVTVLADALPRDGGFSAMAADGTQPEDKGCTVLLWYGFMWTSPKFFALWSRTVQHDVSEYELKSNEIWWWCIRCVWLFSYGLSPYLDCVTTPMQILRCYRGCCGNPDDETSWMAQRGSKETEWKQWKWRWKRSEVVQVDVWGMEERKSPHQAPSLSKYVVQEENAENGRKSMER